LLPEQYAKLPLLTFSKKRFDESGNSAYSPALKTMTLARHRVRKKGQNNIRS
jgi:hypothetical protein